MLTTATTVTAFFPLVELLKYDKERYKNRNRVERYFNRLKPFRRIATRYDKLAARYAAFILIASAVIWGGL